MTNHEEKPGDNQDRTTNRGTPNDQEDSFAAIFAGLTRSLALSFRQIAMLQLRIIKAQLRKLSFQTIRKKSAPGLSSHVSHVIVETTTHKDSISKAPSKLVAFARNSILGIAVFGVYDFAMDHTKQQYAAANQTHGAIHTVLRNASRNTDIPDLRSEDLVFLRDSVNQLERSNTTTPLIIHFVAGAVSGLMQSAIIDIWELINYWLNYRHKVSIYEHVRVGINHHLIFRRLIHHTTGYATLFGCYEGFRRITLQQTLDYFASGSDTVPKTLSTLETFKLISKQDVNSTEHTCYRNIAAIPLASAFMAGGVAGQINFVTNHYTMQWKLRALADHKKKLSSTTPLRHHFRPPHFGAVAQSFLPMALSFLAFQHGAHVAESLLDDSIDASRQFLIYVNSPST